MKYHISIDIPMNSSVYNSLTYFGESCWSPKDDTKCIRRWDSNRLPTFAAVFFHFNIDLIFPACNYWKKFKLYICGWNTFISTWYFSTAKRLSFAAILDTSGSDQHDLGATLVLENWFHPFLAMLYRILPQTMLLQLSIVVIWALNAWIIGKSSLQDGISSSHMEN